MISILDPYNKIRYGKLGSVSVSVSLSVSAAIHEMEEDNTEGEDASNTVT